MQVRVHAEVVNVESGMHQTTNTFNFTFVTLDGSEVMKIMPKTYGGNLNDPGSLIKQF